MVCQWQHPLSESKGKLSGVTFGNFEAVSAQMT